MNDNNYNILVNATIRQALEKYVDFNKLLTAEPLIFDSSKQQITSKHILATTRYPTYYFQWVEVEKGVYAWDLACHAWDLSSKACLIMWTV
jgi:hypothetical protein